MTRQRNKSGTSTTKNQYRLYNSSEGVGHTGDYESLYDILSRLGEVGGAEYLKARRLADLEWYNRHNAPAIRRLPGMGCGQRYLQRPVAEVRWPWKDLGTQNGGRWPIKVNLRRLLQIERTRREFGIRRRIRGAYCRFEFHVYLGPVDIQDDARWVGELDEDVLRAILDRREWRIFQARYLISPRISRRRIGRWFDLTEGGVRYIERSIFAKIDKSYESPVPLYCSPPPQHGIEEWLDRLPKELRERGLAGQRARRTAWAAVAAPIETIPHVKPNRWHYRSSGGLCGAGDWKTLWERRDFHPIGMSRKDCADGWHHLLPTPRLQLIVEPLVLAKPPWWLCDYRTTSHRKFDEPIKERRIRRDQRPVTYGVEFGVQVPVGSWRGTFVTCFDSILPSDWSSLPIAHQYLSRFPPKSYDFDYYRQELGPVWPVPRCHYHKVTRKRREGPSAADLKPPSFKPEIDPRYTLAQFLASTPENYGRTTSDFMQKLLWTRPQIETETTPLKVAA
jgi:hypothetical protein